MTKSKGARRETSIDLRSLLTERRSVIETGLRAGAVEFFMASVSTLTPAEARAKLREDARLYRWNAATMGAILRAIRTTEGQGMDKPNDTTAGPTSPATAEPREVGDADFETVQRLNAKPGPLTREELESILPSLRTRRSLQERLSDNEVDRRLGTSGAVVEVKRVGDYARLFVNGYGIANWPWDGPCPNDSTGDEYANEVARVLRAALETSEEKAPELLADLGPPPGPATAWAAMAIARIDELQKILPDIQEHMDRNVAASPDDLRALGWVVAGHNDVNDTTFWLLRRGDDLAWGEGKTDAEALNQIREKLTLRPRTGE